MENISDDEPVNKEKEKSDDMKSKYKAAAFLTGISGISLLSGFTYAVGATEKSDPEMFDKKAIKIRKLHSAGSDLALRALGWGTLYAVGGFTVFCYLVWKLSGAKNMQDFRMKAGSILPRIPKNDPPQGKTEFENLTDLLQYVIDEDIRMKNEKEQSKITDHSSIPEVTEGS